MVYKVCKAGVRSGNTLRALHSRRTKRYLHQAVLVGSSSLRPKEVPQFLDSTTEDDLVSSTLKSTNVLLSLNKKKRWSIPAKVSNMIQTGSFNEGNAMVSLLERHKLKRKANCVSFVCNQGRIKHTAPKNNKYFSFRLDNLDSEKSNRRLKRQKADEAKALKSKEKRERKEKTENAVKSVEVFTVSGLGENEDVSECFISSKPEYRLEVYYPCPSSCSLTHNPKYTDVHLEVGASGNLEMRSNTKPTKSKRRHRKRFTLRDLKEYEDDMRYDDDDDDEYDTLEHDPPADELVYDAESLDSYQESDDDRAINLSFSDDTEQWNEDPYCESNFSNNILASLITQAENARLYCSNTINKGKNKTPKIFDKKNSTILNEKAHIIYTSEKCRQWRFRSKGKKRQTDGNQVSRQNRRKKGVTPQSVPKYVTLDSARVILQFTETDQDKLQSRFGLSYSEAESEPRRFLINITEDVQNVLCASRSAEENSMYISYLIFIQDGVYDEGLDAFKVLLNSSVLTETRRVSECIPFERTSIEEIMNRIIGMLVDMKQENLISLKPCYKVSYCPPSFHIDVLGFSVKTFHAADEIRRASQTGAMQEKADYSNCMNSIVRDLDADIFCDICYESINPTQAGAVSGTQLSRCGHSFCDECWRSHFRNKTKNGAVKIACPGFDCNVTVGPITLLSLLHVSEVNELFQRACEQKEQAYPGSKWCPNPECGRIIRLDNREDPAEASLDVTCACGQEFCFSCLSQPHWPAKCEQAEEYLGIISSLRPVSEADEGNISSDMSFPIHSPPKNMFETVEVEGRLCPSCSKFIEKNGGCPHMICQCGYAFCWTCMQDYGHTMCLPKPAVVAQYIRTVKVRHLIIPKLYASGQVSKPEGSRGKESFYQKALQQRTESKKLKQHSKITEMARKIVHVSQKNLKLKAEFLMLCGVDFDAADDTSLFSRPIGTHVTKFLRSCTEMKRALHHVAEFTFVLLQDTPDSVDKRRILKLANDLSGYCCFISSILELGDNQDVLAAVKRLADIKMWTVRALNTLLYSVNKIKR